MIDPNLYPADSLTISWFDIIALAVATIVFVAAVWHHDDRPYSRRRK